MNNETYFSDAFLTFDDTVKVTTVWDEPATTVAKDLPSRIRYWIVRFAYASGWLSFVRRDIIREYLASAEPAHKTTEQRVISIREYWAARQTESITEAELVNPWTSSFARRCIDIVIAATALVLLAPVILLIMLAVRGSSPGPIFFRQRRMGRYGKEFDLFKFRTMRVENFTVTGDRRFTPVGSFLRRYLLDELPQFWNVLKGDMSLIGPRPRLPHHEQLILPFRPGITGAATLSFRNEEEILSRIPEDKLEWFYERFIKPTKASLDYEYMRRATPRSDLVLFFHSITGYIAEPQSQYVSDFEEWLRKAQTAESGSQPEDATPPHRA